MRNLVHGHKLLVTAYIGARLINEKTTLLLKKIDPRQFIFLEYVDFLAKPQKDLFTMGESMAGLDVTSVAKVYREGYVHDIRYVPLAYIKYVYNPQLVEPLPIPAK